MQLSKEQFALVEHLLPVQRGNVRIDNLTFLNAILYTGALNERGRKPSAEAEAAGAPSFVWLPRAGGKSSASP